MVLTSVNILIGINGSVSTFVLELFGSNVNTVSKSFIQLNREAVDRLTGDCCFCSTPKYWLPSYFRRLVASTTSWRTFSSSSLTSVWAEDWLIWWRIRQWPMLWRDSVSTADFLNSHQYIHAGFHKVLKVLCLCLFRWKPIPFPSGLGHGGKEPVCNGHWGCHLFLHHRPHSVPLFLQG